MEAPRPLRSGSWSVFLQSCWYGSTLLWDRRAPPAGCVGLQQVLLNRKCGQTKRARATHGPTEDRYRFSWSEDSVKRKITHATFAFVLALSLADPTSAQVRVSVDFNPSGTGDFKFKNVPSPARDDAASNARSVLIVGELDPSGANFSALTDGVLPTNEDQPSANLFFGSGGSGGRFRMDLGDVIEIAQINTYSWHPNTRGPQVYLVYASAGTEFSFNAKPNGDTDPTTAGWKLLAIVDTRPKQGQGGGQYGVSISDSGRSLGKYRYLLFDLVATEVEDDWGNTFYSEIDVVRKR